MMYPKSYTVNNINLNPSLVKSHNGIFMDNVVEEVSYFFSQNEKVTIEDEGSEVLDNGGNTNLTYTGIVSSFYFWMQNRLQYYERNYKRLQDVLSNIGGLSRIIIISAIIVNTLVSNFVILLDTEELVLSLEENEKKKISRLRPNIYNKINQLEYPPKKQNYNRNINIYNNYNNNYQYSSNMGRFVNEDIDIYQNTVFDYGVTKNKRYLIAKKNNYLNRMNGRKNYEEKIKKDYNETNRMDINQIYNSQRSSNTTGKNEPIKKIKSLKNDEILDKPTEKQNFHWLQYIKYMMYCSNKNKAISYYEEFRAKIMSEENLIQNYLDLYQIFNILQSKERKESFRKRSINK